MPKGRARTGVGRWCVVVWSEKHAMDAASFAVNSRHSRIKGQVSGIALHLHLHLSSRCPCLLLLLPSIVSFVRLSVC
jgi:hypothetical protein